MSFTAPEQPAPGQDPQATPDPTTAAAPPAPAAPTPVGQGPWSQDIASIFTDEAARGQADQFLREKVQPYITQLEQKANVNQQAANLWQNFESEPIDTFVTVAYELLGEQAGNAVLEAAQQALSTQEGTPPPAPAEQGYSPQGSDPRTEQLLQWVENQQVEQFYAEEMSRVTADPQNQDLVNMRDVEGNSVINHIHPWVQVAGGDWDRATALLRDYVQKFGVPQVPTIPDPPAVPVLGSDTGTSQPSTTPVQPRKQTMDEAISEFMTEQREARQAPPVGSV